MQWILMLLNSGVCLDYVDHVLCDQPLLLGDQPHHWDHCCCSALCEGWALIFNNFRKDFVGLLAWKKYRWIIHFLWNESYSFIHSTLHRGLRFMFNFFISFPALVCYFKPKVERVCVQGGASFPQEGNWVRAHFEFEKAWWENYLYFELACIIYLHFTYILLRISCRGYLCLVMAFICKEGMYWLRNVTLTLLLNISYTLCKF